MLERPAIAMLRCRPEEGIAVGTQQPLVDDTDDEVRLDVSDRERDGTEGLADACAPSRFATLSSDPTFPLYALTVTSLAAPAPPLVTVIV